MRTIIHTLIVSALITITAIPLFDASRPVNWGLFALLTLLTILALGSLGALIGVISTGSRSTVLWSQLIFLPSMLLGGLMMPLEFLPESLRPFASLLPAAHAMQAFMGLAFGKETIFNPIISAGILASSAVLSFCLAIFLFSWDSRNNSRRGHPLLGLLALIPYLVGLIVAGQ